MIQFSDHSKSVAFKFEFNSHPQLVRLMEVARNLFKGSNIQEVLSHQVLFYFNNLARHSTIIATWSGSGSKFYYDDPLSMGWLAKIVWIYLNLALYYSQKIHNRIRT